MALQVPEGWEEVSERKEEGAVRLSARSSKLLELPPEKRKKVWDAYFEAAEALLRAFKTIDEELEVQLDESVYTLAISVAMAFAETVVEAAHANSVEGLFFLADFVNEVGSLLNPLIADPLWVAADRFFRNWTLKQKLEGVRKQ